VLAKADYTALNDVLDLELEEIAAIPGMTSGAAEELVRFLGELTEEEEPAADEPAAGDEAPSGDEPSAA